MSPLKSSLAEVSVTKFINIASVIDQLSNELEETCNDLEKSKEIEKNIKLDLEYNKNVRSS